MLPCVTIFNEIMVVGKILFAMFRSHSCNLFQLRYRTAKRGWNKIADGICIHHEHISMNCTTKPSYHVAIQEGGFHNMWKISCCGSSPNTKTHWSASQVPSSCMMQDMWCVVVYLFIYLVCSWWRELPSWPLTHFWQYILSGCHMCNFSSFIVQVKYRVWGP